MRDDVSITRPLKPTAAEHACLGGRPSGLPPLRVRAAATKIGAMASAVQIFKDNGRKARELEITAEKERLSRDAEKEAERSVREAEKEAERQARESEKEAARATRDAEKAAEAQVIDRTIRTLAKGSTSLPAVIWPSASRRLQLRFRAARMNFNSAAAKLAEV